MSFRLILFIIIQLAALIFFIEMLRRVVKRINEYHLQDSHHTLPFSFVRLRHIIVLYIVSYLVWLVLSVILYLMFVDPTSSYYYGNGEGGAIQNFNLNF